MRVAWQQMRDLFPYLPEGARSYTLVYVLVSSLLSLLDIAALMLLALSLSSMLAGNDVSIPLFGVVPKSQYVWLLLVVSVVILIKSALSLLQQWFASRKFAQFELRLGAELFDAYLRAPWVDRLSRTTSQLVRMADIGVSAAIGGLILPLMTLPAMVVSTAAILAVLLVAQPLTAVISFVYLGLIGWVMQRVLTKRAVEAGRVNRDYSFRVASLMTDMVGALKEITLRDKVDEVADAVGDNRIHAAQARSNIRFLAGVPKFVMDSALIGGFLLVGVVSYVVDGSLSDAIGAVVLFAVAGMRLVPSLTNYQSTVNTVNANRAQVNAVLGDIKSAQEYRDAARDPGDQAIIGEPKELTLKDVTFEYPGASIPAVNSVSLSVPMGSSVGLVGESGSGKSTLVDIVLGLLEPQSGSLYVDDQNMSDVLKAWRARVGYVPQEVSLFDGTVAQNIALSWKGDIDENKVVDCLKRAQLWSVIEARPEGLHARVGERGMAFSGGQRQRLGIARALYTDPYVLILDEATSSLDTKTESEVSKAIEGLLGHVTVISVAHRLSTVRDADVLYYMDQGRIITSGTFDDLVATVPDFAEQAKLAGLVDGV